MASKKLSNSLKFLLKTGITVLLVWLVFQKIDFNQVKNVVMQADPISLVAALVIYFGSQVLSSWRLIGLLHLLKIPVSFGFNFRLYLLGMFYNVFLPGGIGGDGYKIYLLHKKFGTPAKSLLFAMLFDRASGLWAISILAACCLFLLPGLHVSWAHWYPVLSVNEGAPDYLTPALYILLALAGFYLLARIVFKSMAAYFPVLIGRSLLVQVMQSCAVLLIMRALHLEGSPWPYLFSFQLATIATVIPLSVGGLGIREFVILQIAMILGLDSAVAVSASLVFYLVSTVAAMPGIWFVYRGKEFSKEV